MKEQHLPVYFSRYTVEHWSNWLDDILHLGIAYPVSRFSEGGDALADVFAYLDAHGLSRKSYEKALLNSLNSFIGVLQYAEGTTQERKASVRHNGNSRSVVERLLQALSIGRTAESKKMLTNFLMDAQINTLVLPSSVMLKSRILQVLLELPLDETEVSGLKQHMEMTIAGGRDYDAAFMGHYLRFFRIHATMFDYFSGFYNVIEQTASRFEDTSSHEFIRYRATLVSNLRECHRHQRIAFYGTFFDLFVSKFMQVGDLPLFTGINKTLEQEDEIFTLENLRLLWDKQEQKKARALYFISALLYNEEKARSFSLGDWRYFIEIMLEQEQGKTVARQIMLQNQALCQNQLFLNSNTISSKDDLYIIEDIDVLDLFNEIINIPAKSLPVPVTSYVRGKRSSRGPQKTGLRAELNEMLQESIN